MAKQPFTFENNFDKMKQAIEAAPHTVMKEIGKSIIKELRTKLPKLSGRLKGSKSTGYWYRAKEHDLQVGYYNNYFKNHKGAAWYKQAVEEDNNPLVDVVRNNAARINNLIGQAMKDIGVKDKAWVDSMIGMSQEDIESDE